MQKPAAYSSLRRIGDLKHSFRVDDHDGWVLLDGRTLLKTAYPRFFEVLQISSSTFVLPQAKDALLIGSGGRLALIQRGGSNEITLTVDQIPEHDHGYSDAYEEATVATGGLLSGILKLMTGITAKTASKTTSKAGKGAPIRLEPIAIGANVFVYVGQTNP